MQLGTGTQHMNVQMAQYTFNKIEFHLSENEQHIETISLKN